MKCSSSSPGFCVACGGGTAARLGGAAVAVVLGVLFWRAGAPALIWGPFPALIVLLCLVFGETHFQTDPPRAFQQWKFLGLILVWRREFSLGMFRGVQCRQRPGAEGDCYWHVGFVSPTGRFLAVQWFYSGNVGYACTEASILAAQLAALAGLPQLEAQRCDPQ